MGDSNGPPRGAAGPPTFPPPPRAAGACPSAEAAGHIVERRPRLRDGCQAATRKAQPRRRRVARSGDRGGDGGAPRTAGARRTRRGEGAGG